MIGQTKLKTGGNYDPMPSGKYTLQVTDVNAIKDSYKGQEQDKIKFTFAILNDDKFKGVDGKELTTRGRLLWNKFSTYITPKSYLFKFIQIFDPAIVQMAVEQREVYNLDSLIGKQVVALVNREPNKDGTAIYNNITSFEVCDRPLEALEEEAVVQVASQSTAPATSSPAVPAEAPAEVEEETADSFMSKLGEEEAIDAEAELKKKEAELEEARAKVAAAKEKSK